MKCLNPKDWLRKNKITIFLCLLLFPMKSFTQQNIFAGYYKLVDQAEYALYKGRPRKALQYFEEAEKTGFNPPIGRYYYNQARCYAHIGKTEIAKAYLIKAAYKEQIFPSYSIFKDPYFKKLNKENDTIFFNKLRLLDSLKRLFYNSPERRALADTIYDYVERDQLYRNHMKEVQKKKKSNPLEYENWERAFYRNDSIIQEEIIQYTMKYGYPGLIKSGTDLMGLILIHFSKDNFRRIKPYLINGLEKGRIVPEEIAAAIDRIEYFNEGIIGMLYYGDNYSDNPEYWKTAIKTRQEYGISVYFIRHDNILKWPKLLPWVGKIVN